MSNFIAELNEEEWKAFKEYDERPPTQEEIDFQQECLTLYRRHESKEGDEAVIRFWKL